MNLTYGLPFISEWYLCLFSWFLVFWFLLISVVHAHLLQKNTGAQLIKRKEKITCQTNPLSPRVSSLNVWISSVESSLHSATLPTLLTDYRLSCCEDFLILLCFENNYDQKKNEQNNLVISVNHHCKIIRILSIVKKVWW